MSKQARDWYTLRRRSFFPGDVHVLPKNDLRVHAETEDCWCEPYIKGDGPPFVLVHHSADRREFSEPDHVRVQR